MLSVRERRRAETVAEIKAAALDQLTEAGTGGLSLRAVARAVGVTVQALYHYFDSRDALLLALVTDGHRAVADAVEAVAVASRGQEPTDRLVAVSCAFRSWALANRPAFLLIYGTPVPGFDPSPSEEAGRAALRLGPAFAEAVFDGWTLDELAAVPLPPDGEGLFASDPAMLAELPLPLGALAFFIELRAQMHGMVMLEVLGHLHPFNEVGEAFFAGVSRRSAQRVAAMRAALTV